MFPSRLIAVGVCAVVAFAALTACSSSEETKSEETKQEVGDAAAAPANQNTAAVASVFDQANPGQTIEPAVFAEAVNTAGAEVTSETFEITLPNPAQGKAEFRTKGQADYSDPAVAKAIFDIDSGPLGNATVIAFGDEIYAKLPNFTDPEQYIKFSREEIGNMSPGADLAFGVNGINDSLKEALKSVTYEGEDNLGGIPTQRFAGVIDVAALKLGELGSSSNEGNVQYWFDEANRMVKMEVKGKESDNPSSAFSVVKSGFNEPVTITAPPADQVVSMSDLGSLGGQSSPQQ